MRPRSAENARLDSQSRGSPATLRVESPRSRHGVPMSLNRRHFLFGAAAPLLAQRAPSARKPNILLIVADDLAAWMLGCYGNKEIRTPNIDLLARAGVRFANNFVCTPICSASR